MIFGKTSAEKYAKKQEKLKQLYNVWTPHFCFIPRQLTDGRIAVFHKVERMRGIRMITEDTYSYDGFFEDHYREIPAGEKHA